MSFALALALGAATAEAAPTPDQGLAARLEAAVRSRGLRGARVAALVVSREDGRVLYSRDPDRALTPASNLKVLTAVAALSAFGPAHHFPTEVFADAPLDADGMVDHLYVRGGGNPALTSEDLWRMAADLRRIGLQGVRGGIVLDESAFDGEHWHPSWGTVSSRAYHAPVGALTVNYGSLAVEVEPGPRAGDPVRVNLDPPIAFFRLSNRARTGPARGRGSLVVDRRAEGGVEHVTVSGVVPAGRAPKVYYRSVVDPARYAGAVLRMQLEANRISVAGETRVDKVPDGATPLLVFPGKSLAQIVRLLLKYSNNVIGETLVKAMGAQATGGRADWESGIAAMRDHLVSEGLAVESLTFVDGSGLSYANRVSPRSFVEALKLADDSFRFGPEFMAALPIAAADGTLEKRAEGARSRARAKTGLLTRVTGLSGFAELADGTGAVFSILVNGYRGSAEEAMGAVDGFVAAMVAP